MTTEQMNKKRAFLIQQVIKWAAEHEGEPPKASDWKKNPGWPSYINAYRVFGSFDAMNSAAGFDARGRGRPPAA